MKHLPIFFFLLFGSAVFSQKCVIDLYDSLTHVRLSDEYNRVTHYDIAGTLQEVKFPAPPYTRPEILMMNVEKKGFFPYFMSVDLPKSLVRKIYVPHLYSLKEFHNKGLTFSMKGIKCKEVKNSIAFYGNFNELLGNQSERKMEVKNFSIDTVEAQSACSYMNSQLASLGLENKSDTTKSFFNIECEIVSTAWNIIDVMPLLKTRSKDSLKMLISPVFELKWTVSNSLGSKIFFKTETKRIPLSILNVVGEKMDDEFNQFMVQSLQKFHYVLYDLLNDEDLLKELAYLAEIEAKRSKPASGIIIDTIGFSGKSLGHNIQSVVTVKTSKGHGSGCIVSCDGYIITNNHVIEEVDSVKNQIICSNGEKIPFIIIYTDEANDLALIKVDHKFTHAISLNFAKSQLGEEVFAIGTPADIELGQTVTKGIVSGFRKVDYRDFIQTDVSLNKGNSGGALLNLNGELIGIISNKINEAGSEGLGFAIPLSAIRLKLVKAFK